MKPRVVLLLTQCHDERQMAMQQRCKRERVRQHIREISKWYAGSRRYRRSTEALLQVRDPRTQAMRGIERWTGTEWLLESLLELVQQCRGVGALGPCCIGIALLLLWLLLCEVEVEVEEAAKAAANQAG